MFMMFSSSAYGCCALCNLEFGESIIGTILISIFFLIENIVYIVVFFIILWIIKKTGDKLDENEKYEEKKDD
jgi:prolipoprotein diacylglyceryltransferase